MKSRFWIPILILANCLIIGIFIFQYSSLDYPFVGHDYRQYGARILDSHLHYMVEGFTIQWFTPSFGAGLPAYANPLQIQFSITQFLAWFIDPWNAILISSWLYVLIGFVAAFFVFRIPFGFDPYTSVLGAALFSVNGFMIERVVVGHVNLITLPLISVFILAILHPKWPAWLASILLSLTTATLVYTGGVYIGVIAFFATLLTCLITIFIKPNLLSWRRIVPVLLWGGFLSLLLCGSKLQATLAFMQNFPRIVQDTYSTDAWTAIGGLLFQLFGVMTSTPLLALAGKSAMTFASRLGLWTGTPYGFWELDSSISPVLTFLLIVGAIKVLVRKPQLKTNATKILAGGFLLFTILLIVQFSTARGFLYESLHTLPFLRSLHANVRFTASFFFPLALLGALVFHSWFAPSRSKATRTLLYLTFNAITLVTMWAYFLLPTEVQVRNCDMDVFIRTYAQVRTGDTMPVDTIVPGMHDYEVFLAGASNTTNHYEPLFRDNNSALHLEVLAGSVFETDGNDYNFTNPVGYLYPIENHRRIYERYHLNELDQLQAFLNRHQPQWVVPAHQQILDWTALFTFIGECLALLGFALTRIRHTYRMRSGRV